MLYLCAQSSELTFDLLNEFVECFIQCWLFQALILYSATVLYLVVLYVDYLLIKLLSEVSKLRKCNILSSQFWFQTSYFFLFSFWIVKDSHQSLSLLEFPLLIQYSIDSLGLRFHFNFAAIFMTFEIFIQPIKFTRFFDYRCFPSLVALKTEFAFGLQILRSFYQLPYLKSETLLVSFQSTEFLLKRTRYFLYQMLNIFLNALFLCTLRLGLRFLLLLLGRTLLRGQIRIDLWALFTLHNWLFLITIFWFGHFLFNFIFLFLIFGFIFFRFHV